MIQELKPKVMKTNFINSAKAKILLLAAFFLLIFGVISCDFYYGLDGRPGRSYLALEWNQTEPNYIEAGNRYIPELFYWGEYYRVPPGIYLLYYEGEYYTGKRWITYAWELEYEVWENPGEPGRPNGIDGMDGADVDFTIVCAPGGPTLYIDEYYKSAGDKEIEDYEIIQNTGDIIEIMQTKENFTLRVKYKKVEPRYIPDR
jgi:hypothetical protein